MRREPDADRLPDLLGVDPDSTVPPRSRAHDEDARDSFRLLPVCRLTHRRLGAQDLRRPRAAGCWKGARHRRAPARPGRRVATPAWSSATSTASGRPAVRGACRCGPLTRRATRPGPPSPQCWSAERYSIPAIRLSKGIFNPSCSLLTIRRLHGCLRFSSSQTRLLWPMYGSRSRASRPSAHARRTLDEVPLRAGQRRGRRPLTATAPGR